ncbi:periodic tryptophan protein 2 homolog isoform X2 [Xenia sp. Carnegie-2017]|uniref:periodic tryptophan protein 2 homolog isoform X2 n=1 Tax=Xenia sp. Carnegie-2017 TaxID=2897299 RepID=UPI001F04E946|nr:periodic tryptophan protein 2 homolog isoform X2 [Xenia sp. Carnegie-2017]
MKFSYKFSNLIGTVYTKGNLLFSSNGDRVLSPVGNRVSIFDLKRNKTTTLPFENGKNIKCMALSPNDQLLITIDEDGKSILSSLQSFATLHYFTFKTVVYDIKFSPNGRFFAVTIGMKMQVWITPGRCKEFAPVTLHRTYTGQYDNTICIDWSSDSKFIVVGSKDMTARIFSIDPVIGFVPTTLTGHRNVIINSFFELHSLNIYTISQDGAVFTWSCSLEMNRTKLKKDFMEDEDDDEEIPIKWKREMKYFYHQDNSDLSCAAFHKQTKILIAGFSSGVFSLHEMPEFNLIHTLSISQRSVSTVAVNPSGEWLAFGCSSVGQLLVWEWRSETYILKQQGHFYDMNVLAYSPDGQYIVTGGDDGKVKIWNTTSGFCFITFHEHSAAITGVCFTSNNMVILSSSLDGTVRAFDLNRYRNFRTFASPRPSQFSCLAVDHSGEVVAAGSLDTFEIFLWSMQTGRLLEVIAGHESPVSCLAFSSSHTVLLSGSWDKTVKIWNIYSSQMSRETLLLNSDVVALAIRPDGKEVAVATLDGQLTFWHISTAMQLHCIEGQNDLGAGRKYGDRMTAKTSSMSKCFTSLCYTADGCCILAGGKSKFVCIYNIEQQILVKRFEISRNRSFDGMQEFLNSGQMTEAGPLDLIDDENDGEKLSVKSHRKDDMSSRNIGPEIRVKCLRFSPTGRAWSATTTEGLLTYSLDVKMIFDPYDLSIDVTPHIIRQVLNRREFGKALMLSLRLNEEDLILHVIESIPTHDIKAKLYRNNAFTTDLTEEPHQTFERSWKTM